MEIIGKVTGSSKPKMYKSAWDSVEKFALFVEDDNGEEHKAMVVTMMDEFVRSRPYKGDTVKYTTRSEKNGWGSVTTKQEYEIIDNAGKEAYFEELKRQEDEEEERIREWYKENEKRLKAEKEAEKQRAKDEEQAERDSLPEKFGSILTERKLKVMMVKNILRDTYHLGPISEGEGGQRDDSGYGGGHPGSGMRRPNGSLYNMPGTWRSKYLNAMQDNGLIDAVDGAWVCTALGYELLKIVDSCPDCGELRGAYTEHYYQQTGERSGISGKTVVFTCLCKGNKKFWDSGASIRQAIGDRIKPRREFE